MPRDAVLYLTPGVYDKGGISRYCRYQIKALRDICGAENTIVLSLLGPRPGDLETDFAVDFMAGGNNLAQRLGYLLQMVRFSLRVQPAVVWVAHVNLMTPALLLARILGTSCVLNVYGREVWSNKKRHVQWGLDHAPHLVSDCHFTADYMRHSSWRGDSIHVAWDCVDTARFSPGVARPEVLARYGLDAAEQRFRVLMLGRISRTARHKGWERLVELAAGLAAPSRYRFVLAGEGDFRAQLQELVGQRGLAEHFRFTGSVHEDDLVDLYRFCDVFFLVSDRGEGRGEGIPLTPLEAAACGKPIMVGNQDGSQEAVLADTNGFVLDPFDLPGQLAKLELLAEDRALRQRMGAAARARIQAHHAYEVFRNTTAAILADLGKHA